MGSTYVNLGVRTEDRASFAQAFERAKVRSYISPSENGAFLVAVPEVIFIDPESLCNLNDFCSTLVIHPVLGCAIFDSDFIVLVISYQGKTIYLGSSDQKAVGDLLASKRRIHSHFFDDEQVLLNGLKKKELDLIFRSNDTVLAEQIHRQVSKKLALPEYVTDWGMSFVEAKDYPAQIEANQIIHLNLDVS